MNITIHAKGNKDTVNPGSFVRHAHSEDDAERIKNALREQGYAIVKEEREDGAAERRAGFWV